MVLRIPIQYKLEEVNVVNLLDCDIEVSEFELQSRNYAHFRTNTPHKGINPFIPPAMN